MAQAQDTTTATRPRAVITGALARIAGAFAARLADEGYDVVLVARRSDRLDELARRLRHEHGATAQALGADLIKSGRADSIAYISSSHTAPAVGVVAQWARVGCRGDAPVVSHTPDGEDGYR